MTARSDERDVQVQRVGDGAVEDRPAPPARTPRRRSSAASAPGWSRNRASAPVSFSIRSPTHSGWNTVSGCSRRPNPSGANTAGAQAAAADEESGPQPQRPDRRGAGMRAPGGRRAERGDEHERHQAQAAIDEDDRRRQRLRPGRPGGVADADDVAADIARQEVVEEDRDQARAEQRARCGTCTCCASSSRRQRHAAAPHVDREDQQRDERATAPTPASRVVHRPPTSMREKSTPAGRR